MSYPLKKISEIINGKLSCEGDKNALIIHLLIDSRKITHAETSLFFAIKGERHDGHKFLNELYDKGVRNFVISDPLKNQEKFSGANFIKVDDTLSALQTLSAYHRQQFSIPVIGITG